MGPHPSEFVGVILAILQDRFNRDVRAKCWQTEVRIGQGGCREQVGPQATFANTVVEDLLDEWILRGSAQLVGEDLGVEGVVGYWCRLGQEQPSEEGVVDHDRFAEGKGYLDVAVVEHVTG